MTDPLTQRGLTPEQRAKFPFAAAFERAHGHEDNPSVGDAYRAAEAVVELATVPHSTLNVGLEHKGDGRLRVILGGTDEDSGDSIVTFQAVRP